MDTLQRRLDGHRRRAFDRSIKLMKDLGFASWAIEYYTVLARATSCLPHELIVRASQAAALGQLETLLNQPSAVDWRAASRN